MTFIITFLFFIVIMQKCIHKYDVILVLSHFFLELYFFLKQVLKRHKLLSTNYILIPKNSFKRNSTIVTLQFVWNEDILC